LLVDPEDPSALARGLDQLLSDEELRKQLAAEGVKRAEDFDLKKIAAQWCDLIGELCG